VNEWHETIPAGPVTEADLDARQKWREQWDRERAAMQLYRKRPPCAVDCAYCAGQYGCAQVRREQRLTAPSAEQERDPSTPGWRLAGRLLLIASGAIVVTALVFATA
jgi:hypothetical protein